MLPTATQFGRGIAVEIVPPEGPVIRVNPARTLVQGGPFHQLRVRFDYEKSIKPQPNRASVVIHNLGRANRNRIAGVSRRPVDFTNEIAFTEAEGLITGASLGGQTEITHRLASVPFVRVLAGYRGALGIMFEGTGMRVSVERNGPEWLTTIDAKDGGLSDAAISNSHFPKGFPAVLVASRLVSILGWSSAQPLAPGNALLPAKLLATTLTRPWVAYGQAREALAGLLGGLGIEWFVDDGELWIVPDTGLLPFPPVTFDRSGAPGSSFILEAPHRVEGDAISVSTLLSTAVRVGGLVNVVSAEFTGSYRCERVKGSGDNWGGQMVTRCLLRDLSAIDPFA